MAMYAQGACSVWNFCPNFGNLDTEYSNIPIDEFDYTNERSQQTLTGR